MNRRLLPAALVLPLALPFAAAGDWSRFRGPNGTGVVDAPLPPTAVSPATTLWKVPVPGKGVSSPIVVKGKVILQTATPDGAQRLLMCFNAADGKTLWVRELPGQTAKTHVKNSLASGTAASDGENVYVIAWDGERIALYAFGLDGTEKWTTPIGPFVSQHGPGHSPVLHGGKIFINYDQDGAAAAQAYDAKTGKKVWEKARKPERACYSSPFVLERPGHPPEILFGSTHEITAYQPDTGAVVWAHKLTWPAGKMALRSVGSPTYSNGLVFSCHGDGGGSRYMTAIDPNGPKQVWEASKDTPYVPCALTVGPDLYWMTDPSKGSAVVKADAKTGKFDWNESVFTKPCTASPILVGDTIVAISEDGLVAAIKTGSEFEPPAVTKLGEGCFASPAAADGKLFIRGTGHLFCIGKK